jgi:hypothetical protein
MADDRAHLAAAVGKLFVEAVGPAFAAACGGGGAEARTPPGGTPAPAPGPGPPRLHYTFDAYVHTSGRARLIDINPVGGTTAPLLFEWGDLFPEPPEGGGAGSGGGGAAAPPPGPAWPEGEAMFPVCGGGARVPFRIVEHAGAVAPGRTLYGAPHDMVAGEAVEELARRLRAGELGEMGGG